MMTKRLDICEARECYELMDQSQLLRLKQAYFTDLEHNINTEEGVLFAVERIAIIDQLLEEEGDNGDKRNLKLEEEGGITQNSSASGKTLTLVFLRLGMRRRD